MKYSKVLLFTVVGLLFFSLLSWQNTPVVAYNLAVTDTPVPPTDTPVPPTDTPVPPTDTPVPTLTNTPPPGASSTPVPTATNTPPGIVGTPNPAGTPVPGVTPQTIGDEALATPSIIPALGAGPRSSVALAIVVGLFVAFMVLSVGWLKVWQAYQRENS